VGVAQSTPLRLREQKVARPLFTQIYQALYNQEYCCMLGIKRAIVERRPALGLRGKKQNHKTKHMDNLPGDASQ
jgi:hypothetical protein